MKTIETIMDNMKKLCPLLAMLIMPTGCAFNSNSSKADGIVNSLVSERLTDSCLVKITEARYEKSNFNRAREFPAQHPGLRGVA